MNEQTGNRRQRVRENTVNEILTVARQLLADGGPEAVSNTAIARAMGMTTPALYRYYTNHQQLVGALTTRLYQELTDKVAAARATAPTANPAGPLLAMCRAMRAWALHFPVEFCFLFTNRSLATLDDAAEAGTAFGDAFLEELASIWNHSPFPVRALATLPPGLADQMEAYSKRIGNRLPAGGIYIFLNAWTRLYGVLSMEVLHQLEFALDDVGPFFEGQLQDICDVLDVRYET
ncbi:MAG: TetR/AcrR family transcriptional regulator [Sphingopyxis sp.]|uniref:TetR/AcrR family transcriptional regulator n=1 Tax=Sphingopyxis sp. TaxID=1908224 RepID=UPI002ABBC993|nr:TetR/AcrR family transcriptional regulator [Sphingopyxis sp.]MDZ3831884.1 TetR/AcrR family transcriptional regulator [Sphingopyxis sp.]